MKERADVPTIYRLAYETAVREHEQQQAVLDNLRARAGVIMSAATVALSFLAGQALTRRAPGVGLSGLVYASFAVYFVAALATAWVILPYGAWSVGRREKQGATTGSAMEFNLDIEKLLVDDSWQLHGDAYVYEHMARFLYEQRRRNEPKLDRMMNAVTGATIAYAASVVLMLFELGR